MTGRGRTPKFTDAIVEQLAVQLASGIPILAACESVGIRESTYYNWIKASRQVNIFEKRSGRLVETVELIDLMRVFEDRMRAAMAAGMTIRQQETYSESVEETRYYVNEKGEQVPYAYKHTYSKSVTRELKALTLEDVIKVEPDKT